MPLNADDYELILDISNWYEASGNNDNPNIKAAMAQILKISFGQEQVDGE